MNENVFDQACRYLAKLQDVAFLVWVTRLTASAFRFGGWIDARRVRFPGEPDRTCDTVAYFEEVSEGGRPWAWPIEFQIKPDFNMFGRMMVYLGLLWLEKRPNDLSGDRFELGATIVNLTGLGNSSRSMVCPMAGTRTEVTMVERNLASESAALTLAGVEQGTVPQVVLALIPLMQGGSEAGMIEAWVRIASAIPDERLRADLGGLALVFAEAGGCREVWKKSLEGWNVIQSQQVLEWQAEASQKATEKTRIEERRGALKDVLEERFGQIPLDLAKTIELMIDHVRLRGLLPIAVKASSLDAFRHDAGL